jgi:hypothetical protein
MSSAPSAFLSMRVPVSHTGRTLLDRFHTARVEPLEHWSQALPPAPYRNGISFNSAIE